MLFASLYFELRSIFYNLNASSYGSHVELRQTLESVSKHCHLIERLFFESSKTGIVLCTCNLCYFRAKYVFIVFYVGRDDSLKLSPTCSDLVQNCPNLNSLALRGFKLQDFKISALIKVNYGCVNKRINVLSYFMTAFSFFLAL